MSMKRKQLKINWEYETVPCIQGADCAIPVREPDFKHDEKSYWFNEMRCLDNKNPRLGEQRRPYSWVMDECPRTGAVMVLNSIKSSWHIQPKPVLDAYHTWLAEHFFME